MNEFFIDFAFSVLITILKQFIKNPDSRETMRKAFLKAHKLIKQAYAGDPDFE